MFGVLLGTLAFADAATRECPSMDAAKLCEDGCQGDYNDCQNNCMGDSVCAESCKRPFFFCLDECPCHDGCPNGCEGCSNWSCFVTTTSTTTSTTAPETTATPVTCDSDTDLDAIKCFDLATDNFDVCNNTSSGVLDLNQCYIDLEEDLENCPCGINCPYGCPCENFDCRTIEGPTDPSVNSTLLIIYTEAPKNSPPVIKMDRFEEYQNMDQFDFGLLTQSFGSCSAVLNGEMYIFGGQGSPNQISMIEDCGIKRTGVLPMGFYYGQCNTYVFADSSATLLCFEWPGTSSACHSFDGTNTTLSYAAVNNHYVSALGEFDGYPVVIAGTENPTVEIMKGDGGWAEIGKIPSVSIYYYHTTATMDNILYTFGGWTDPGGPSDMVMKFDGTDWTIIDSMLNTRYGHRTVVMDDTIVHVGGIGEQFFEKWIFGNGHFVTKNSKKSLVDYYMWPETFVVNTDFCI